MHTIGDLLEYFPRDWIFAPEPIKIGRIEPDQTASIVGLIESTDYQDYRRTPIFEVMLADETGVCRLVWFNGGYLRNQLQVGQMLMASGKVAAYKHQIQLVNPKFLVLDEKHAEQTQYFSGGVYPATAKLTSRQIKRIIVPLLDKIEEIDGEFYNPEHLKKSRLISRADALRWIHMPPDEEKLAQAKRRLKYDELFLMQLGLALRRYRAQHIRPRDAVHVH